LDGDPEVIVVGRVNDVHLYRELIRRGVSEYLVAPLNPLHVIETISGLYINPKAQWSSYKKVLLKPVEFWDTPDTSVSTKKQRSQS